MNDRLRLGLLCFLMLFLELGLIRWLGSNVYYLSYFSNFVLLGSFLGIGIGFLLAPRTFRLFPHAAIGLAALIGLVSVFPLAIDRSGSDLVYFGFGHRGIPIWLALPVIFLATAAIMAAVAQEVGKLFGTFAPLDAYRLDLLGSIAGVVAFTLLSFAGAPPVVWGAIVSLGMLALGAPVRPIGIVSALVVIIILGHESLQAGAVWSPYYKLVLSPPKDGVRLLSANGIPHQTVQSVEHRRASEPLYFVPYARLHDNPLREVMIIGAGTGGDVAIALAHGAKHIDAVEIDPRIYELGKLVNPNHPYDDPRVTVHVTDGRAFLQRTNDKYDLILLALPDSLALVSGQSSLRLESYLFTLDAMRAAQAHLRPGGAFGMYNYYRERWLVDRFAGTLQTAFGSAPCLDAVGETAWFALLMVGHDPGAVTCAQTWRPASADVAPPVSDDDPFPYLQNRQIPTFYVLTLASILLVSLLTVRAAAGSLESVGNYLDLTFMGAAFLLLETKNVVQFALLFGTTWLVNALVFVGILVSVYLAVEVAARVHFRSMRPLYIGLFAALTLAWLVPPEGLLALDAAPRFLVAGTLAFAPVFIANLIFAERFRSVATSTVAFAANLLGAIVGGVIEYAALIVGYRALLVVVAALYGCAFVAARLHRPIKGGESERLEPSPAVPA